MPASGSICDLHGLRSADLCSLTAVKNENVNTNSYLQSLPSAVSRSQSQLCKSSYGLFFVSICSSVKLRFIYLQTWWLHRFSFSFFPIPFFLMDIPYFMSLELLGGVSWTLERLLWFSACKAVISVIRGLLWKWNHQDPVPRTYYQSKRVK